jgi:sortase system peptidoglycan-associated protein
MNRHAFLAIALAVASVTAQADQGENQYTQVASKEETTGFFSGIVFGSLVGGPPGAIVGGALGKFMGDGWNAKQRVGDMQANIYELQLMLAQQHEETDALRRNYQLAKSQLETLNTGTSAVQPARFETQSVAPCCDNTVLSLHFRSGSSTIEPQFEEQLQSLVRLARQMPTAVVEITGYADRNGDAERNLLLSRARGAAVKHYLEHQGIADAAMTTVAYGEAKPLQAEQNLESDFFDRRVIVRLRDASKQMLTQNPEGR